jgi:carboxypeptidase family protein
MSNPLGKFVVPTLPLGRYRLSIAGVPPGYYVKSAIVDKTDILSEGLTVQRKISSELEISLWSNGGQISGIVRGTTGGFANGSVVTLVPVSDGRLDPYQVTRTDADGRFTIAGIVPGDYHIFAWDRLASQEYYSSGRFTGLGQFIRIKEGDRLAIDLRETQTNP